MDKTSLFFFCLCNVLVGVIEVQGSHHHGHHHHHPSRIGRIQKKLFVFGDSYADTGNIRKSVGDSWKEPYGITFPGKPTGRFSDGRVLTDFLASFMGIHSPVPYRWKDLDPKMGRFGMNFAYGGAGVLDTIYAVPNMTTQIEFFQQVLQKGLYTKQDLQNSIGFVSIVGNDYTTFEARNGSIQVAPNFITSLVTKLASNLKRLNDLGLKRIAVNGLQPLGCLPSVTRASGYQQCNETLNQVSTFHNALLHNAVTELHKNGNGTTIAIFDLFSAFNSILRNPGYWKIENPLVPCCKGVTSEFSCGSVNGNGTKLYTVCQRPDSALFWDGLHPSQAGWAAISSFLKTTLYSLSS